jgi:hypothetical protein
VTFSLVTDKVSVANRRDLTHLSAVAECLTAQPWATAPQAGISDLTDLTGDCFKFFSTILGARIMSVRECVLRK